MSGIKQETTLEGIKSLPALGGAAAYTLTLSNWVAIATIAYIVVQMAVLLHRHYYFIKEKRRGIKK